MPSYTLNCMFCPAVLVPKQHIYALKNLTGVNEYKTLLVKMKLEPHVYGAKKKILEMSIYVREL